MQYILTKDTVSPSHPIGGKARALAILGQTEAPVPSWVVITPEAFFDSLTPEQQETLRVARSPDAVRAIFNNFELKAQVRTELEAVMARHFKPDQLLAVRSSAMDEDHADYSFAGQLESFLFVPQDKLVERVIGVWKSGFTEQVLAYRVSKGLPPVPTIPAVLIQVMVNATASGVAFGADPVSGNIDIAVVSGVYGLGSALVSGECDADVFHVDTQDEVVYSHIADKRRAARYAPDAPAGVVLVDVPEEDALEPCLTDAQLCLVAQWARYCGRVLGGAQDIEWAFVGDEIFILQSRPITTPVHGDPGVFYYYWDNDDLDSWTGVTTPLTFSFIRRFYYAKFRHLAKFMGVPADLIRRDDPVYRRMLGLLRGRIYYNVASLEEIWALVPGFRRYRRIFDDWIGMAECEDPLPPPDLDWKGLLREHLAMARTLLSLVLYYYRWDKALAEFYREVNRVLTLSACDLSRLNMDRLVHQFHQLEGTLVHQWAKPTINNFFAGFFYTRLAIRTRDWCGDQDLSLRNNLLCGEGGMYSSRPIKYLEKLAWLAVETPELVDGLCDQSLEQIETLISQAPEFYYHYRRYLAEYGQRCHESSLMESPNIADEPLRLLRSIGYYARRLRDVGVPVERVNVYQPSEREMQIRKAAEAEVARCLAGHPLRQWVFQWTLRHARGRVRDRENIRFVQTLVMGRFRMVFLNLGRCFQALDLLDDAQDVFYLEVEEVVGFVEGTSTCSDLKGLVALRKAEFNRYRTSDASPDRFETRSSARLENITEIYIEDRTIKVGEEPEPREEGGTMVMLSGNELAGLSCSPGLICGPVAFVDGDLNKRLAGGEILVAELGDPGLVMLFPAAGGLLFEKGSPLSHLSIVAREMGIPTIVSIAGLRGWLQEGDWVEMDGKTGLVRKISPPAS